MQGNLQNKTDIKPIENETITKVKGNRGRQEGYKVPEVIIQIDDTYRINLSDGKNKTVQKFTIKENDVEEDLDSEEDEDNGGWKFKGHYGTFKGAFDKLHSLMLDDGIRSKAKNNGGVITVKEFYEIHKTKLKWLQDVFKSDFEDNEVVSRPKYVKKIEEKKGK